jgi:hydrogenase maturation protease
MTVELTQRVPVLVIGYGNDLRGDDGLGPHVATAVEERRLPGVRTLMLDQLTPDLAEELAAARLVVFVDARVGPGGEAVNVCRLRPSTAAPETTHLCEPPYLLALAQALYERSPEAWSVTVAGERFEIGEHLSDSACRHVMTAVERIEWLVRAAGTSGDGMSAAAT